MDCLHTRNNKSNFAGMQCIYINHLWCKIANFIHHIFCACGHKFNFLATRQCSINNAHQPESEVYAIGCRKGSDLTAKINEAIEKLSKDGTLAALAEKYGLTNDLIANIGEK